MEYNPFMAFGIYVHIPYCLQKCHYCDFSTTLLDHPIQPREYVDLIIEEIKGRNQIFKGQIVDTVYFGGGTPSLIDPYLLGEVVDEIKKNGFLFSDNPEITIEINPETLTEDKLEIYKSFGINRFSVGVQTFKNDLLKLCGRKHSSDNARSTLELLTRKKLNFSLDLIYALPGQTKADFLRDLDWALSFKPPHISAYELNVPKKHWMSKGKPTEALQAEMMLLLEKYLKKSGLEKYEISNFAKPGYESRHNSIYWDHEDYWGLGVSSHSFKKNEVLSFNSPFRFWNPRTLEQYKKQIHLLSCSENPKNMQSFPLHQVEHLKPNEALTDYCYTFLRMRKGLSVSALRKRFGPSGLHLVNNALPKLISQGLIQAREDQIHLTQKGEQLSNLAFLELTFSEKEWRSAHAIH